MSGCARVSPTSAGIVVPQFRSAAAAALKMDLRAVLQLLLSNLTRGLDVGGEKERVKSQVVIRSEDFNCCDDLQKLACKQLKEKCPKAR